MAVTDREQAAMAAAKLDMISVSDFCVDLVLRGNVRPRFGQVEQMIGGYTLTVGGSANIFAAQVARLGGQVGLIGVAGTDLFGRFALESLARLGVDTARIREDGEVTTGLGVALTETDDRAILTCAGSIDAVTPAQLHAVDAAAARHAHIASYFLLRQLRPHWPVWCRRMAAGGVTISLDTNGDPDNRWAGVTELLPLIDVFLPNAAEARAIAGERDLQRAGTLLAAQGPLVVIKDGGNGAWAFPPEGGAPHRAAPINPPTAGNVVDTVGAGDCFDAGFLWAWQRQADLDECLRLGLRCAEASLRAPGGLDGQLREVWQPAAIQAAGL